MIVESQRRTSQIVAAYVRKNLIPTNQIAGLINSVHSTLSGLGNEVVEEPPRVPAVSIRGSVRPDYIICIECGYKGQMLKKHLQSRHGLSVVQYKLRWNLSSDYPMTAPVYSERRSQFAKSIGLGRTRALSAATTTTEKPSRRRSAITAIRTRTSVEKASVKKASAKRANPRTSAKKASARTSAKKASARVSAKKASPRVSAKKASPRTSAMKASNRSPSRKPSPRAATKTASAPKAATA
jgi:predicted transcriptional regulator